MISILYKDSNKIIKLIKIKVRIPMTASLSYKIEQLQTDFLELEILRNKPKFDIKGLLVNNDFIKVYYSFKAGLCIYEDKKSFDHYPDYDKDYRKNIKRIVDKINNSIEFIKELWEQYPLECEINEHLSKYAILSAKDSGLPNDLALCNKLVLPYTRHFYNDNEPFEISGSTIGGASDDVKNVGENLTAYITNSKKLIETITTLKGLIEERITEVEEWETRLETQGCPND